MDDLTAINSERLTSRRSKNVRYSDPKSIPALIMMHMLELTRSLMQSNGSTGGDFRPQRPALVQRCHGNHKGGGVSKRPLSAAVRLKLPSFNIHAQSRRFLLEEHKVNSYFHNARQSVMMI